MKKKYLFEAVGVPKNILVSAQRLYSDIITPLSKEINDIDTSYSFIINPNPPYQISDIELSKIEITVNFHIDDHFNDIQIIRYGFMDSSQIMTSKKDVWNRSITEKGSPFKLSIEVGVSSNRLIPIFIDYLSDNKIDTITTLSHELKHYYDRVKRPNMELVRFSKYVTNNEMLSTGVTALNKFMFYLYFISSIETLVYSTEVYSNLKQLNTTKKEFLSNLQKTRVYSKLKEAREFTMEVFLKELESESETIKKFYSDDTLSDIKFNSDQEMIVDFLERIFDVVFEKYLDNLNNFLYSDVLERMFGFIHDIKVKNNKVYQLVKQANSFVDNKLRWYEKCLKTCNIEADKAIRKISKIYSLIGTEETNESIIDPIKYSKVYGYDVKIQKLIKDAINNRVIKDN